MQRILGIDYGAKRIGLAISDEEATLAFPKEILFNDSNVFKKIIEIVQNENISSFVVGDSVDLNDVKNPISEKIDVFVKKLESEFNLPVYKQKEFFTSVEARGRDGKEQNNARKTKQVQNVKIDDSAAALILQRYLDKKNKSLML